jgi:hypothetical protein
MKGQFLILSFILYLSFVESALYFNLFRDQKRCFHDEFYTDLAVMVRYNILDKGLTLTTNNDKRFEITLIDDEGEIAYTHTSSKLQSKFSYIVHKSKKLLT